MRRAGAIAGALLGLAVGDALGLPFEGMPARRVARLIGDLPLRHRLVLGRGLASDDTEHACMTGQAILASRGEPEAFERSLAWRLRGWFAALPAGVGLGTAKACVKLWIGFGPARSGVRSAGNGPAMRAPVIGAWAAERPELLAELTRRSTRLTHTHPAAEDGALAVALAAAWAATVRAGAGVAGAVPAAWGAEAAGAAAATGLPALSTSECLGAIRPRISGDELRRALDRVEASLDAGDDAVAFAASMGLERGVSGYINHTVPAALFCFLRHGGDYRAAVEAAIRLGGDTDTTAAIVGALCGAAGGPGAIPAEWVEGYADWPRSKDWILRLAARLAGGDGGPLPLFWPAIPLRNLAFLAIVLAHGLRRLLPPY